MLRSIRFHFPRLVFLDQKAEMKICEDEFKDNPPWLYRVDWDHQEKKVREDFDSWNNGHWKGENKFTPPLPEPYDTWIKESTFALTPSFYREITRNVRRGVDEWCVERDLGGSTMREVALGPAIEHFFVAFYLLGDCAYDPANKWYLRGPRKSVIQHAMACKFWAHQTGSGMIWDHARLDLLKSRADAWYNQGKTPDQEEKEVISSFLSTMDHHCYTRFLEDRSACNVTEKLTEIGEIDGVMKGSDSEPEVE
jgi:hypothetical protein